MSDAFGRGPTPRRGVNFKSLLPSISLGVGAILAAVVVVVAIIALIVAYSKTSEVNFKLTGKESVSTSDGNGGSDHEYRLYTTSGTYKVTDSTVHWRHNSADVYGKLIVGQNYTCTVYGFRIPLGSSFKNVLHCEQR